MNKFWLYLFLIRVHLWISVVKFFLFSCSFVFVHGKNYMSEIISELQTISENAVKDFSELSAAQINWRPSEEGWSVGQCFEHLIKSNVLFFDKLDEIADGKHKHSMLESFSPLSGFFGNLLINSLKKDSRKFKSPTQKIVPPSEIDANIIEIFAAHQSELIGKIKRTETADWHKTKVTSPFMKLMTYKLSDGYQVIVEHEKRHFRQAERALKTESFPKPQPWPMSWKMSGKAANWSNGKTAKRGRFRGKDWSNWKKLADANRICSM